MSHPVTGNEVKNERQVTCRYPWWYRKGRTEILSLLENHPGFEVVVIAASPRSAGKTYEEAVGGRWKMQTPMPEAVKKLSLKM